MIRFPLLSSFMYRFVLKFDITVNHMIFMEACIYLRNVTTEISILQTLISSGLFLSCGCTQNLTLVKIAFYFNVIILCLVLK